MLSVTVDVETGAADALVLEGANTGRMWSSLSAPEKAGIGMAITDMAGRVFLDILEIGSV